MKLSSGKQRFLRRLRRILRDSEVRATLNPIWTERLNDEAMDVVSAYESNGKQPRFLMDRMERLIAVTLRASESEMTDVLVCNLKRFLVYLKKSLCLQQGSFHCKKSTCSICLQEGGGSFWASQRCGHSFHVQCIAKCFGFDQRCPLCRNNHL
jgi:hypothetical protein